MFFLELWKNMVPLHMPEGTEEERILKYQSG
jgi:hypothetical protein